MTKTIKLTQYDTSTHDFSEKNISIPDSNSLTKINFFQDITSFPEAAPGSVQEKVNSCITAINSMKAALISFGLMNEQS